MFLHCIWFILWISGTNVNRILSWVRKWIYFSQKFAVFEALRDPWWRGERKEYEMIQVLRCQIFPSDPAFTLVFDQSFFDSMEITWECECRVTVNTRMRWAALILTQDAHHPLPAGDALEVLQCSLTHQVSICANTEPVNKRASQSTSAVRNTEQIARRCVINYSYTQSLDSH